MCIVCVHVGLTFASMSADCLHTFEQQVLMNVIHFSLLLREYQHLDTHMRMVSKEIYMYVRMHVHMHSGSGYLSTSGT